MQFFFFKSYLNKYRETNQSLCIPFNNQKLRVNFDRFLFNFFCSIFFCCYCFWIAILNKSLKYASVKTYYCECDFQKPLTSIGSKDTRERHNPHKNFWILSKSCYFWQILNKFKNLSPHYIMHQLNIPRKEKKKKSYTLSNFIRLEPINNSTGSNQIY